MSLFQFLHFLFLTTVNGIFGIEDTISKPGHYLVLERYGICVKNESCSVPMTCGNFIMNMANNENWNDKWKALMYCRDIIAPHI